MARPVFAFCLLSLLSFVGCRMCNTPYDYRVSTSINRCDDYRGFHPLYRAGSIFGNGGCDTCQTAFMDTDYVGDMGDLYHNAGSYGVTSPISTVRRTPDGFAIPPKPGVVSIPSDDPRRETITEPRNRDVPSVQELRDMPRGGLSTPNPLPLTPPPVRPRVTLPPSGTPDPSIETIPFSPSDEVVVPPETFPIIKDTDPPITLEELRRLDPSVKDIQIISIEDAGVDILVR
jgi:hypothetical protein